MRNLLRYLGVGKRNQDDSDSKVITAADRVRLADEMAQAYEQKSRAEKARMTPAEYLYAARVAFSKREPEHGQALCETLLKEFPNSSEAKDAEELLRLSNEKLSNDKPSIPEALEQKSQAFEFRGNAPEYFRIWIVNILLTILTLGIYSAWAKVRKRKYFYRNTYLQGDAFDYHADPTKILKGRLIAVPVLVLYLGMAYLSPGSEGLLMLIFSAVFPWLIVRAQMFNTRNTSYRNIRFSFAPNYGDAYGMFFGYGILTAVTFGLAYPLFDYKRREFVVNNARFGESPFELRGTSGTFFMIYLKAIGLAILLFILGMVIVLPLMSAFTFPEPSPNPTEQPQVSTAVVTLLTLTGYFIFAVVFAYMYARKTNHILSNSFLAGHQLQSDLSAFSLIGLYITNLLAIVFSLGLAIPWASVRIVRYRLSHTSLLIKGDLDEFAATAAQDVSATGEEIGDIFDFDFGF